MLVPTIIAFMVLVASFVAMATTTNRKRKADVIGRQECSDSSGRGASSGWTTCPLCASVSSKKYALGRGIASHLQAVHAPWKVSKMDRKIQRRGMERKRAEAQKLGTPLPIMAEGAATTCTPWEPTEDEEIAWAQRVLELAAELEQKPLVEAGVDRTGEKAKTYRESLPDVIQAAADGTLTTLQALFQSVGDEPDAIRGLLNTKDRNGSTAEHWAAGEGHLELFPISYPNEEGFATRTNYERCNKGEESQTTRWENIDALCRSEWTIANNGVSRGDGAPHCYY